MTKNTNWDIVIKPEKSSDLNGIIKSILQYRDLLLLFVRRDFVAVYKQTILGPLWFFIQPILTTITFTIIFGNVAQISTDGAPKILFYLSGITLWNYFADCINQTSTTFTKNQGIFGKVYFPRLIIPLSIIITNLIKFGIQLLLFISIWLYYYASGEIQLPSWQICLLPLYILIMGMLGLGVGSMLSSLTTKYRDLTFLVTFGVQLLMYASPIIYPVNIIPEKYKLLIFLNPMSSIIENFKVAVFGGDTFYWGYLLYSFLCSFVIMLIGVYFFRRNEKSFIDTV